MSIFWLHPVAWWGLAALVVPVLIHLLVRQQRRRLEFPSLRFLRATRLAAVSRQTISDWPLLAIRLLILAAAVAALASPVFVSAGRRASWNARVARAIVVVPFSGAGAANAAGGTPVVGDADVTRIAKEEQAASFVSEVFAPETIADGLRGATLWLERQPPAAREIVILGDLRAGLVTGEDLDNVPPSTGVRWLPIPHDGRARATLTSVAESAERDGDAALFLLDVTLDDAVTTVTRRPDTALTDVPIAVRAAPEDALTVEAALRAVLAEGVVLHRDSSRRVVIVFDGAPAGSGGEEVQPAGQPWMRRVLEHVPDLRGGEQDGALIVHTDMRGTDPHAVHLIARVVHAVFADDLRDLEPRRIPASTLSAWSRPPGPAPDVPPGDEGDRRFLWGAALALLLIEHLMRRARRTAARDALAENPEGQARVA